MMMKKYFVTVALSVVVGFYLPSGLGMGSATKSQTEIFTTRLFQQIAKDNSAQNFVISADSLAAVLQMLQYGATGETQQELSQALCDSSQLCHAEPLNKQAGYLAANAIWVQEGLAIKSSYSKEIQKRFKSEIETVNFQKNKNEAVKKINTWAKKNTKGMIEEILKPTDIDPMTALVLTNALYFQGFWPTEFDAKKTTDREFTLDNGKTISVPTMIKKDHYFQAKKNKIQMIGLPYRDSKLEMVILMPEDPKKFHEFAKNLSVETILSLVAAQEDSEAFLQMPKFSIASSYSDLKATLKLLGIKKVFEPEAELKNINDKAPLFLSKVLQKAVIEVNEKGTKAAAVSAGIVLTRAVLTPNLQVDRPFIFAIVDQQSKQIPFMGQVVNPIKK
jgi:serpin B